MARKSRKNERIAAPDAAKDIYSTAVYARLSVENDEDESSITTQIELIKGYIESHSGLVYKGAYIDNGYTGTNFERPGFKRLIEDAKKGVVNCIAVKDMSRFGRDYIETGYYIETVFPFLGVRFIAVNDNFDSSRKSDMDGLLLPIKNMINMMYAKDISKKVWTALQQKKENGYSAGNTIPYGYVRNGKTRRNEIDYKKAVYVFMMFKWKLDGVSIGGISRRLDMLQVPTPRKREKDGHSCWNPSTVSQMLRNRAYIGDTVSNKTDKALFGGREKTARRKDEWIITEGTHEAIIAKDDFNRVQEILKAQGEKYRKKDEDSEKGSKSRATGIVYCAECGFRMRREGGIVRGRYACKRHGISEKALVREVTAQINGGLDELLRQEAVFTGRIDESESRLAALANEGESIKDKCEKLYEERVAGRLDDEGYMEKKAAYQKKRSKLNGKIADEKVRLASDRERKKLLKRYYDEIKASVSNPEMSGEFVKKYIKRIEVGSGGKVKVVPV